MKSRDQKTTHPLRELMDGDEKCRREWGTTPPYGWQCCNDCTGCLYNDGHNTCFHPGFSTSPCTEDLDESEWEIAWWAGQAQYHTERGDIIPDDNPSYFNSLDAISSVEDLLIGDNMKRYRDLVIRQCPEQVILQTNGLERDLALLSCPSYIRAYAMHQLIKEMDCEFHHGQTETKKEGKG